MSSIKDVLHARLPTNRIGHILLDRDTKIIESSGSVSASLAAEVLAAAAKEAADGKGLEDSADSEALGRAGSARLEGKTIAVPCTEGCQMLISQNEVFTLAVLMPLDAATA